MVLAIFLIAALTTALVLTVLAMRHPSTPLLLPAALLVVVAVVTAAVADLRVPWVFGLVLTLLGVAVAVVGGSPVTRRVLQIAAGARVRETPDGGITLVRPETEAAGTPQPALLRGGTVIGYLERVAAVVSLVAGYPAAIAVIIALKSVGRFTELAASEARERFIIGTMASLTWACAVGGLLRLVVW